MEINEHLRNGRVDAALLSAVQTDMDTGLAAGVPVLMSVLTRVGEPDTLLRSPTGQGLQSELLITVALTLIRSCIAMTSQIADLPDVYLDDALAKLLWVKALLREIAQARSRTGGVKDGLDTAVKEVQSLMQVQQVITSRPARTACVDVLNVVSG
jgi:hypothetical protein